MRRVFSSEPKKIFSGELNADFLKKLKTIKEPVKNEPVRATKTKEDLPQVKQPEEKKQEITKQKEQYLAPKLEGKTRSDNYVALNKLAQATINNTKQTQQLAVNQSNLVDALMKKLEMNTQPIINLPDITPTFNPKIEILPPVKKRKWEFKVERNHSGFITKINVVEL